MITPSLPKLAVSPAIQRVSTFRIASFLFGTQHSHSSVILPIPMAWLDFDFAQLVAADQAQQCAIARVRLIHGQRKEIRDD
jgi:hypothetical protein